MPTEGEPVHLIKRNNHLTQQYSRIENIKLFGRRSKLFKTLEIPVNSKLVLENDILSHSFIEFLKNTASGIKLVDGSQIFRSIRSIKSKFEINQIKKAASLVDESFEYCTQIANPNMTEIELASLLDSWLLNNGHSGYITTRAFNSPLLNYSYVISSRSSTLNILFTPISGYGLSTKYPYGPSRQKLGKNQPFIIDTCGNHIGYISDTTRTFVCGHFDKDTREQQNALKQIIEFLKRSLKPQRNLGKLYNEVMELSKELRIDNQFMGTNKDRVAFLGHGIGLELDELPIFYPKGPDLISGNTLACEPKFYIQNEKILGIEDTFAITESGNELLSKSPNQFEISS
ncbi:MAG: M24 family metallopeptidase [Candidatus Hodarchaeales archaeon]